MKFKEKISEGFEKARSILTEYTKPSKTDGMSRIEDALDELEASQGELRSDLEKAAKVTRGTDSSGPASTLH